MKTEPTEALANQAIKKITDSLMFEINYEEDNYDAGYSAALHNHGEALYMMGFLKGQSNPKIRQLEWTFTKNEGFSFTPFVNYRIYYWKTAYNENKVQLIYNKNSNAALNGHDGHELIGEYDDCDSAIRAAQTDFENRVKECLE